MRFIQYFYIVLVFTFCKVRQATCCPVKCDCFDDEGKVTCNSKQIVNDELKDIASAIKSTTIILELVENNITDFDTQLFARIKNLKTIDIRRNRITKIPNALPSLESLKLTSNFIKTLEKDDFKGYGNLRGIDLYGNDITVLSSDVFSHLTKLTTIFLEKNAITTVEQHAFRGLSQITEIELGYNQIENIDSGVFRELPQIKKIFLYDNKLKSIPSELFANISTLQTINLNNNQIKTIDNRAFQNLQLNKLELKKNNISKVSKETFHDLSIALSLELDGNPLKCDCNLYYAFRNVSFLPDLIGKCGNRMDDINSFVENNVDDCTVCWAKPCHNNGNCSALNDTSYTCDCQPGFLGRTCQFKDMCQLNPCKNNATCVNIFTKTDYKCNCSAQFYGKNCGDEMKCFRNPCLNGGECHPAQNNTFTCGCKEFYKGDLCEFFMKEDELSDGAMALIIILVLMTIVLGIGGLIYWKRRHTATPTEKTERVPFKEEPTV